METGDACVTCAFSRSIPNMREYDRGKVFCTYGQCNVHTNGLCDRYREGQFRIQENGSVSRQPVKPDWRTSVRAASARAPLPVVREVPHDDVAEQEDLF